ncbi:hypothetical protein FF38_09914 [Lucilia cuprina]|uniref:Uncharacterized protein n=1 Tax=Lucilia cuprina TaxID=7375 RepID=A0A0L0CNK4_LUCCU|nr:hypothetical protein FF38_09914 [Lucilia cuprina]
MNDPRRGLSVGVNYIRQGVDEHRCIPEIQDETSQIGGGCYFLQKNCNRDNLAVAYIFYNNSKMFSPTIILHWLVSLVDLTYPYTKMLNDNMFFVNKKMSSTYLIGIAFGLPIMSLGDHANSTKVISSARELKINKQTVKGLVLARSDDFYTEENDRPIYNSVLMTRPHFGVIAIPGKRSANNITILPGLDRTRKPHNVVPQAVNLPVGFCPAWSVG